MEDQIPQQQRALLRVLKRVASQLPKEAAELLGFFYCTQESKLSSQVRAYTGMWEGTALVLLDMRRGKKYVCDDGGDGKLDAPEIVHFVQGFARHELLPHVKTETRPEDDIHPEDDECFKVVGDSFEELVVGAASPTLLIIYEEKPPVWFSHLSSAMVSGGKQVRLATLDLAKNDLPDGWVGEKEESNGVWFVRAAVPDESSTYHKRFSGQETAHKIVVWLIQETSPTKVFQNIPGEALWRSDLALEQLKRLAEEEAAEIRRLSDECYTEIFDHVDADGSGHLTQRELLLTIRKARMAPSGFERDMAEEYMSKIDTDSDGTISREEWTTFFKMAEQSNGAHTRESLQEMRKKFGLTGTWHAAFHGGAIDKESRPYEPSTPASASVASTPMTTPASSRRSSVAPPLLMSFETKSAVDTRTQSVAKPEVVAKAKVVVPLAPVTTPKARPKGPVVSPRSSVPARSVPTRSPVEVTSAERMGIVTYETKSPKHSANILRATHALPPPPPPLSPKRK